jgi:hypothetical protein
MPSTVPELSEMLKADRTIGVRRPRQSTPGVSPPRVSAAAAADQHALEQVIDAWPKLPRNVRAGILAMIDATQADEPGESGVTDDGAPTTCIAGKL